MAKDERRGNREAKKPKKEKPKVIMAAPPFVSQGKATAPAKTSGGKR